MKKFLYITYYYPPIQAIASMRSWKLTKYIREYGWEPVVLASSSDSQTWGYPLPDVQVDRLKNNLFLEGVSKDLKERLAQDTKPLLNQTKPIKKKVHKIASFLKRCLLEIFAWPDEYTDWRNKAIIRGQEIIANEKIDLILSSAGPFSNHIIASVLSKKTGIPWIADYRDLWTQNSNYHHTKLRRFFERGLEKYTLNKASAVVTVSEPLASELSVFLKKTVFTVTNGFDPEDYSFNIETDSVFSIVYTGVLYEGKRTPALIFEAVRLLLYDNQIQDDKFGIHFYGSDERFLKQLLRGKGIDHLVYLHDSIPLEECIRRQKAATVLLFVNWSDRREKGIYSGKIFEYLAANRPILAFPRNHGSVVDSLLERSQAGVLCDTPEEIARVIKECYDTFYSTGYLPFCGIKEEIEKYSRRNQAQQISEIFNNI